MKQEVQKVEKLIFPKGLTNGFGQNFNIFSQFVFL